MRMLTAWAGVLDIMHRIFTVVVIIAATAASIGVVRLKLMRPN